MGWVGPGGSQDRARDRDRLAQAQALLHQGVQVPPDRLHVEVQGQQCGGASLPLVSRRSFHHHCSHHALHHHTCTRQTKGEGGAVIGAAAVVVTAVIGAAAVVVTAVIGEAAVVVTAGEVCGSCSRSTHCLTLCKYCPCDSRFGLASSVFHVILL